MYSSIDVESAGAASDISDEDACWESGRKDGQM
jgi:hypothetical protein